MATDPIPFPQSPARAKSSESALLGSWLVIGSAIAWSFGGTIDRFISVDDTWTVVFWRSVYACSFLIFFLVLRDRKKSIDAFRQMGWPGIVVALCFMTASISFVQAIALTTVANVILINATVPLAAALIAWLVFGEGISGLTWAAIAAVIIGVALMVSDGGGDSGALAGNLLALLITFVFAVATVVTRRYSGVRMTPAVILATALAGLVALTQAGELTVSNSDMGWLFAFGALNLGLGMALFVTGARLVPAANSALFGTLETVLGPIWVWLIHGEKVSVMTMLGGLVVVVAITGHLFFERRQSAA